MQKLCECGCGTTFEAARRSARFASPACRVRANRAQRKDAAAPPGAQVVQLRAALEAVEPTTVLGAIETGDDLATLRMLRRRVAKAVDDPNCPTRDLAALQRSLRELTREIRALELAAKQEADEEVPQDVRFNQASV